MVEHTGKGEAPSVKACPVEVAKHPAGGIRGGKVANDRKLVRGIFPRAAVKNEAIDPAPKFLIQWFGEFRFPPEAKREIGVEVREDNVGERMGAVAIESEGDLFGANLSLSFAREMAVGADPGFGFGNRRVGVGHDQNRTAGMLAGDGRDDFGVGGEGFRVFRVNDEIDQRGAGLGIIAGFPEMPEFLFDFSDFHRKAWIKGNVHGVTGVSRLRHGA